MKIIEQLLHLDQIYYIAAGAGILIIIALIFIIRFLIKRNRLATIFKKIISDELSGFPASVEKQMYKMTGLIIRLLSETDTARAREILYRTGLSAQWVKKIAASPDKKHYRNILQYNIREGFFYCFKYALEHKKWHRYLTQWLDENSEQLPLQTIAHSSNGESFDGKKAYALFEDKKEEIKEMLADPDWKGRYFALKILLAAKDPGIKNILIDLFNDPSPVIRKTLVQEYKTEDSEELRKPLSGLLLKDPNPDVRREALRRYRQSFTDLPEINVGALPPQEVIHLIEALLPQNRDDEGIATMLMLEDNSEIQYHAARYLEKSGTLGRFCTRLDMADPEDFKRKTKILKNAATVGVTGFIRKCVLAGTRESLTLAAELLNETGDIMQLGNLLKMSIDHSFDEAYRLTVEAIVKRGDRETKRLVCDEITRNISQTATLVNLLKAVTPVDDPMYIDPLLTVFEKRDDLVDLTRKALITKNTDALVERLITIIESEDSPGKMNLRIQSLFLLAQMKKEYCLSFLFEHLSVLPVSFVSQFAGLLAGYPKKTVKDIIAYYLNQIDGELRAHIIALIPALKLTEYLGEVRKALEDADPLVRIASTFALVDMDDTRSFSQALSLMRDPVEEVRNQVAFALGSTGRKDLLRQMAKIFYDKNEVDSVKRAIIRGITDSKTPQATDLLIDFLQKEKRFSSRILSGLVTHTGKKNIEVLIDRMKDGSESLKEVIASVFSRMGMQAQPALIGLLESELSSHKAYASEILDHIGTTEAQINKLKHRDLVVRREAAEVLSLIGTIKAFRGLVMASRDPDQEVRINVVRALEKLETKEGKTILKALNEDPDAKIRKYTHWALERLRAKELV